MLITSVGTSATMTVSRGFLESCERILDERDAITNLREWLLDLRDFRERKVYASRLLSHPAPLDRVRTLRTQRVPPAWRRIKQPPGRFAFYQGAF